MHLSLPELKDMWRWVLNLENESTYIHTHKQRIPRMSRDPIGSNKESEKWQKWANNICPTKCNIWTTTKFDCQDQLLMKHPRNK